MYSTDANPSSQSYLREILPQGTLRAFAFTATEYSFYAKEQIFRQNNLSFFALGPHFFQIMVYGPYFAKASANPD